MPKLWPVLSQGFTAVFQRLGIQAVPAGPQWWMSDTIVPVSLLDSDVTLQANVLPRVETPTTVGNITNPAAGAILATTGQLALGNYLFRIYYSVADGTNGNSGLVSHRNAADAADLFLYHIVHTAALGQTNQFIEFTLALAENERVRVTSRVLGAGLYQAIIFRTLLP